VSLNGLAVVAAVAGDANLSVHEIGGEVANTRTALFVDARATESQRAALVAMAKSLSKGLVDTVVEATPASIEFSDGAQEIRVATSALRLVVQKQMEHDVQCGNKQWFQPFSTVDQATMGVTAENRSAARRSERSGAIRTSAPRTSGPSRTDRALSVASTVRAAPSSRGGRAPPPAALHRPSSTSR
jgi:hypothetical protein